MSNAGEPPLAAEKQLRLRYAGACRVCGRELAVGARAVYERVSKTVRCLECGSGVAAVTQTGDEPAVAVAQVSGTAGASARREFERRRAGREERIRAKHPKLGGFILAVSDEPQSTRAWATGAVGEERLGTLLDAASGPCVRVLHDRRIPRTRANIDHIVVCASGVFVVDAKRYGGRPHLRVEGGILRERTERLMVGSRDATKLVEGVHKQVALVRDALGDEAAVDVRGLLCFVDADWPLIGGTFITRGVSVLWPKKLASLVCEPGALSELEVGAVHERLASAFPVA
jgi:Nuclease-related domain